LDCSFLPIHLFSDRLFAMRIAGLVSVLFPLCLAKDDSIPVIEIRGEGKPMSSAQIRHLDEQANGGPLQIKVERRWKPDSCERTAEKDDWVTFHYKMYLEDGRKVYTTYDKEPITIQLGSEMTIPGLDQGITDSCETEVLRVSVPWRLAQKEDKGSLWKHVPSEEHWLRFDVEVLTVTKFSLADQFKALDRDGDIRITEGDLVAVATELKEKYGKGWRNNEVDNVLAAKYFLRYFDQNNNASIDFAEFQSTIEKDEKEMEMKKSGKLPKGLKRKHGLAWVLDFNNDGVVTDKEIEESAERFEKGLPEKKDEL
ncbi:hypothetical protein PENTCL1PPCAC_22168, partial [Pristionchus entomophagus]